VPRTSGIVADSGLPFDSQPLPRIRGNASGNETCSVAGAASPGDATVAVKRFETKHLFYGHADWVIAEVCCVHIQTARHWKAGIRKPGPSSLRLWQLHVQDRILTDEWKGYGVRRGKLYDPEGHEFTQGQLRSYSIIWQLVMDLSRDKPEASSLVARLAGEVPGRAAGRRKPEAFMPDAQFKTSTPEERDAVFGPHPNAALRTRSPSAIARKARKAGT